MKNATFPLILSLCAVATGAFNASPASALDITLIDTSAATSRILFLDSQGNARLRACKGSAPATRDCVADGEDAVLPVEEYVNKLPFPAGNYSRNDAGLAFARANLDAARENGAGPEVVARLEASVANLERIKSIRTHLTAGQDVTLYEFKTDTLSGVEASQLFVPFTGKLPGPGTSCANLAGDWEPCGSPNSPSHFTYVQSGCSRLQVLSTMRREEPRELYSVDFDANGEGKDIKSNSIWKWSPDGAKLYAMTAITDPQGYRSAYVFFPRDGKLILQFGSYKDGAFQTGASEPERGLCRAATR